MIGNTIRELRKEKKMSQSELGKFIGVSQTTVTAWETGRAEPSSTFVSKLADLFNVSTDYLLGRSDSKKEPYYELTEKEKNDIAVQAEKLMDGIESGENLNFYGEPATEEQKERLLIAIQTAMEMNKRKAKKKFTPKKYRD
ncbi:Transcriptional regulator [Limosilactobacillus reuteri]|uniref:Transcriptional regulator n=1 Tax=Limosilactobacillus reuteri TaxID=1598 RepID=A0A0U5JYK7_LIMRT|nr:helix-turn-helix transcriptional regulator [Limosilactobacillus reuteri]MBV0920856.1 helix-turn-helix transcriptional regulator [Limosilactobacillus reuteri]MCC4405859.1 helix-turn-helix transcriptional regulator [Limosilactobacillus reuteri]MDD7119930.1 helix-turn-helix transcriptional regulator [Limosilactobacillus reuteri]OTA50294.1 transcriptional regulator [Limosilactobacillus reuteri]QDR72947.1 helix-turn-helix transcriptional regulator [Limosilactobacillus reuteri]